MLFELTHITAIIAAGSKYSQMQSILDTITYDNMLHYSSYGGNFHAYVY